MPPNEPNGVCAQRARFAGRTLVYMCKNLMSINALDNCHRRNWSLTNRQSLRCHFRGAFFLFCCLLRLLHEMNSPFNSLAVDWALFCALFLKNIVVELIVFNLCASNGRTHYYPSVSCYNRKESNRTHCGADEWEKSGRMNGPSIEREREKERERAGNKKSRHISGTDQFEDEKEWKQLMRYARVLCTWHSAVDCDKLNEERAEIYHTWAEVSYTKHYQFSNANEETQRIDGTKVMLLLASRRRDAKKAPAKVHAKTRHRVGVAFFFKPPVDSKRALLSSTQAKNQEKKQESIWFSFISCVFECSKRWNWLTYLSLQYYLDNSWAMCHPFDNGVVEYPNFQPNTLMQPFCEFHPVKIILLLARMIKREGKTNTHSTREFLYWKWLDKWKENEQFYKCNDRQISTAHIAILRATDSDGENKRHQFAISHYSSQNEAITHKNSIAFACNDCTFLSNVTRKLRSILSFSFAVTQFSSPSPKNEWSTFCNIVDISNWHLFSSLNLTEIKFIE